MFKQRKWIAVVRGRQWIVAKVGVWPRKRRLKVYKLLEFPDRSTAAAPKANVSTAPDGAGGAMTAGSGVTAQGEGGSGIGLEADAGPRAETGIQAETGGEAGAGARAGEDDVSSWLRRKKFAGRKLSLALSSPGIITRIITLPVLPAKVLDRLLTEQVGQYFTVNIADYLVDYRVVERFREQGEERQRLLLAAVPRKRWEELIGVCQEAGLSLQAVDLTGDCLAHLYSLLGSRVSSRRNDELPGAGGDVAVVGLNNDLVEIVLLSRGTFFLYTDLAVDLSDMGDLLFSQLPLPQDKGEAAGGSTGPEVTAESTRPEVTAESTEPEVVSEPTGSQIAAESTGADAAAESTGPEVAGSGADAGSGYQAILENRLLPVFQALTDFNRFFASRHQGKTLDTVFITGEYADLPLLAEVFRGNLEIETRVGFPGDWQPSFARRMKGSKQNWMKYGQLYGLAFRER
ncbi:competence protein A [Peptococcaceae bacterium CEB3]|nr:competence protein A [Peptococcaceae bacterium CEB3]